MRQLPVALVDRSPIMGGVTAPTNSLAGLTGLRRWTWWTTVATLALIVGLVGTESAGARPVMRFAAVAAGLLAGVVSGRLFAVAMLGAPRPRTPVAGSVVVVTALAAAWLVGQSRAAGSGGFPATLPLAALLAAAWAAGWSWRRVWPAGIALAGLASLGGSASGGAVSVSGAVQDVAIGSLAAAALYAQVWALGVAERLDVARRLESAAAVTDERLRFAADLHDIQGHSLQVIALKSELAERLATADPARAAAEMREVQALARQTLGDTREVVRGYRAVSLDTEISNAGRVLAAAGIDCSLSRAADLPSLPSSVENLLGLVVRECTTNVLRHSAARQCAVSLAAGGGTVVLSFTNDAPLDEAPGPAGGLVGLADRLAAVGGRLAVDGAPERFTVSACVPVSAPS
jgi:two-component system sensor histidine kinase DesK